MSDERAERLRAEVEKLTKERDEALECAVKAEAHDRETCECLARRVDERDAFATEATFAKIEVNRLKAELDHALVRAEKAEAELKQGDGGVVVFAAYHVLQTAGPNIPEEP